MIVMKDMDMPTDCSDCQLCVNGYCAPMKRWQSRSYGNRTPKERPQDCPISEIEAIVKVESTGMFDQEEIHENCTVQILSNSVTGEVSIGWWHGDREGMFGDGIDS